MVGYYSKHVLNAYCLSYLLLFHIATISCSLVFPGDYKLPGYGPPHCLSGGDKAGPLPHTKGHWETVCTGHASSELQPCVQCYTWTGGVWKCVPVHIALISVSGEDSRSLLRHLATLGTVAHWVTHSVGVSLRTHKAVRGVSSLKTF